MMSKNFKPLNKVMSAIGLIDDEDDENVMDEEEVYEEENDYNNHNEPEIINTKKAKLVSIKPGSLPKVSLRKPDEFQDIMDIVDEVKQKRIVIMNVSEVDPKKAQRMIDYIVGSCYALGASFEEISKSIYVIAPDGVEVTNELKQQLDRNTFFSFNER